MFLSRWFYSCVILNDYKTGGDKYRQWYTFYSCVILNDYKTNPDGGNGSGGFYSCVILYRVSNNNLLLSLNTSGNFVRYRFACIKNLCFKIEYTKCSDKHYIFYF